MQSRSNRHLAFGAAIREVRKEKGLSQERLALDSGIDRAYVGGVERGERNASLTNIFKLADALGVKPSELHARAEKMPATRR